MVLNGFEWWCSALFVWRPFWVKRPASLPVQVHRSKDHEQGKPVESAIAMCRYSISVVTGCHRRSQHSRRQRNLGNFRSLQQTSSAVTSFSVGLWNCQSAVNKADFISGYANHLSLGLLALTETWIKPENNATPAALSTNYAFSHTPRPSGRGGGTGLLTLRLK